jgi:hypothetical protein
MVSLYPASSLLTPGKNAWVPELFIATDAKYKSLALFGGVGAGTGGDGILDQFIPSVDFKINISNSEIYTRKSGTVISFDYRVIHSKVDFPSFCNEEFLEIMMTWTEHKIEKENFCHIYSDLFTINEQVANLLPVLKQKYKL